MPPGRESKSTDKTRIAGRWMGLDRGWQAVLLGLAIVSLQWMRQLLG